MMARRWRTGCPFLPLSLILILLGLLLGGAAAGATSDVPVCFDACEKSLRGVRFADSAAESSVRARECGNALHRTSLFLCVRERCGLENRSEGLGVLNGTCQVGGGAALPPFEAVVGGYSEEDVKRLERFDGLEGPGGEVDVGRVVLPTERLYGRWWDTLDATEYVYSHHYTYGWAMGYFWAAVVAIGMVNRLVSVVLTRGYQNQRREKGRLATWMSGHVLVPATFGHRMAQSFGQWCTLPPRVQSLTIASFIILNVVLTIHGYRIIPDNIYFPGTTRQVLRYLSDRTGIVSFANFPIIWLFGMRNNIVIWLTGWDFGTYSNFHRWVARVATLQAVIHSIGYTVLILREGGWTYFAYWWTLLFWWAGELATVFMCALLAFSFYWIRRGQYELFLLVHIVLSVFMLITMLLHVSIFNGEYDLLIWVPAGIWILDRLLRIGRVLAFNFAFWNTKAHAVFNPATNMIRLDVPCSRALYRIKPGMHFYLMVLSDSKFWESHPFTVASMSDRTGSSDAKSMGEDVPLLESEEENEEDLPLRSKSRNMSFLIRPYDSSTSRLRDLAAAKWPKPAAVRVLIDGPYGHTQPLQQYGRAVFVVGGSGIVVPLSYLHHLLSSSSQTESVHIHWAVRERDFAMDVLRQDFGKALASDKLQLHIYLGFNGEQLDDVPGAHGLSTYKHRLDVRSTVLAAGKSSTGSRLAVVACGPAKMADDARKATGDLIRGGRGNVDYFEESFQW